MMTVHGEARQPGLALAASRAQFGVESFKTEPSSLSLVSFKPHDSHECKYRDLGYFLALEL